MFFFLGFDGGKDQKNIPRKRDKRKKKKKGMEKIMRKDGRLKEREMGNFRREKGSEKERGGKLRNQGFLGSWRSGVWGP